MGILWNNIKMVYYGDRLGMVSFTASAITLYLCPIIWQVSKGKIYSTIRIFFNWRIIALKHCVSFCHTSAWVNNMKHEYIPSLLKTPSHLSVHPTPLGCHRGCHSTGLSSLCHTANSHFLSILHMVMCMFPCYSLSSSHPLLTLLCPQVCSLCLCFYCCPSNRLINTIFLDSIHMN